MTKLKFIVLTIWGISLFPPLSVAVESCAPLNIRCVDDTLGSTQEYNSVSACASAAQLGDTCLVFPGNYPEYVQTARAGSASSPITFRASNPADPKSSVNNAVIQGFRIKHPYITIEGFDISKYPIGLSPAHITVEGSGSNCTIRKNYIHDGVTLLSDKFFFDASTRRISIASGGLLAAGFRVGTSFYVASNINHEIKNANIVRTIKTLTDTEITVADSESLISEGPVLALLYATRTNRSGVAVIKFPISSSATAEIFVITYNRLYNLGGMGIGIVGAHHLVERNVLERMNGWLVFDLTGHDNTFRYNHIKNSPRYQGMEPPDGTGPDQTQGGHWDFVSQTLRSFGIPTLEGSNNIFEFNFIDSNDNELFNITEKSGVFDPQQNKIVYSGAPARRFIFRNNVVVGLELDGAIHRPESVIENNTFYRSAQTAGAILHVSSGVQPYDVGSAEGSIVRNNIFIDVGKQPDPKGNSGWYTIDNVTSLVADYNFVAGPKSAGFPAKAGFIGQEAHGVSGGDPYFKNIEDPIGPDGIPFTADDGLRPLQNTKSPICGKGYAASDLGAYPCERPSAPVGLRTTN